MAVLKLMVPPKTNDLDEQQRWRWVVFAFMVSMLSSVSVHLALACGWIPSVYPGFALASETKSIERKLDLLTTIGLEREMRAKMQELCHEREHDRRNELNDDVARLQRDYWGLTKQWYQIPRCDQL
jgi:hypothetical protein